MGQTVAVLIDWQNAYRSARRRFNFEYDGEPNEYGNFSPLRAAEMLTCGNDRGAGGDLVRVEIHRGLPSSAKDPIGFGAVRRQSAAWMAEDQNRVIPRLRPLRYPAGWPAESEEEKGVDVQLAMSAITALMVDHIDTVILFTRDTDLLPCIETMCGIGRSSCVETASWAGTDDGRMRLPQGVYHHTLDRNAYDVVADLTNYAHRRS